MKNRADQFTPHVFLSGSPRHRGREPILSSVLTVPEEAGNMMTREGWCAVCTGWISYSSINMSVEIKQLAESLRRRVFGTGPRELNLATDFSPPVLHALDGVEEAPRRVRGKQKPRPRTRVVHQ